MNSNLDIELKPVQNPSSLKVTKYIHWIHCNACYEQYMHKRRSFYLLACDHVICQQCSVEVKKTAVNGPTIFKCPLCQKETRACKMGNDMPSQLKQLFHPELYLVGLNTQRIMLFQEKHRRHFFDYLNRQYASIQQYKLSTQKERELTKKLYQDLETAKDDRKRLEKRVLLIKKQRKETDEKRNLQSCPAKLLNNSSSSSSHENPTMTRKGSSANKPLHGPGMPKPTGPVVNSKGVTTFSSSAPNFSFML